MDVRVDRPFGQNDARPARISVGRQDFLYQADKQFADALKAKGVNVTYKETEGGHFWNIWRNNIHETAQILFARRR